MNYQDAPTRSSHPYRRITRVFAGCALLVLMVLPGLPRAATVTPLTPDTLQKSLRIGSEPARSGARDSVVLQQRGGYLTTPASGDALDLALAFLRNERAQLSLTAADLSDFAVTDRYTSQNNGVTHIYLRQSLGGVGVRNALININVAKDGRIVNSGSSFVGDLQKAVNTRTPQITAIQAVERTAQYLRVNVTQPLRVVSPAAGVERAVEVSNGGFAQGTIPAKLAYEVLSDGSVRLVWQLVARLTDNVRWLDVRVDAVTGNVLSENNLIVNEWAGPDHETDAHYTAAPGNTTVDAAFRTVGATPAAVSAAPVAAPGPNSYLVYELPKHDPSDGPRTLTTNPADPRASPFGWHDTNGQPGAEYIVTRGNNVHAYEDQANDDVPNGNEPNGGPTLVFSNTLDLNQQPQTYTDGATVNLFYINNKFHDLLVRFGFDEISGNFQETNYRGAGLGGDYVQAQAQDGGGTVNANFATPPDGQLPRMQMYLGASPAQLTVNAPAAIAGSYGIGAAGFGAQSFNLTGDVVYANDGVIGAPVGTGLPGTVNDGCEAPFVNAAAIAGKIALIDRGYCAFVIKAANAQAAGAIGVIIANNAPGGAPAPGGNDPNVTIPVVGITLNDGNAVKGQLANSVTVNVTMVRGGALRDGSLDNGVILHEYGHGISNRLTGGPANTSCLTGDEQAGEGWSDLVGVLFTAQPTDTRNTAIPIGTWLSGQAATAGGFRNFPYTTNTTINPFTYDSIKSPTVSVPHGVGTVWATMYYEVYWNLVDAYGFNPDLAFGNAGNSIAIQLLLDGMKFQPCNPTFVQARDAILAADVVNSGGQNQCRIWQGFAKRGLGFSATSGSVNSRSDGTQAFDLAPECTVDITPDVLDVCAPNPALYTVIIGPNFAAPAMLSATGNPAGTTATFASNPASGRTTLTVGNTAAAAPGSYTIRVRGTNGTATFTPTAQLNLANAVPTAATLISPTANATGVDFRPTLGWTGGSQGLLYTVHVASTSAFTDVVYLNTVRGNTLRVPATLRENTTYYWRVLSDNACGSGATSTTGVFTTRNAPDILLVDDAGGTPSTALADYSATLNALGRGFDVWNGSADNGTPGNEPDAAAVSNYNTVIWFGGQAGVPGPDGDAAMESLLNNNGCVIISSQEYFARRGITEFMTEYLGVVSAQDDANNAGTTLTGVNRFAGLGPYTPSFSFLNYTDVLVPGNGGLAAFDGPNGVAGVSKATAAYRSNYFGFALEALATADRQAVLGRALAGCTPPFLEPTATATATSTTVPSATATAVPSATATATAVPSATATATAVPSATATTIIVPSATATTIIVPSATATTAATIAVPSATATTAATVAVPSATATTTRTSVPSLSNKAYLPFVRR